jgi:hypothetical protein
MADLEYSGRTLPPHYRNGKVDAEWPASQYQPRSRDPKMQIQLL